MACYYAGNKGNFFVNGFPEAIWTASEWDYSIAKSLVEITNSLSFGKDQFIGNTKGGTITVKGIVNEDLWNDVISANQIDQGDEIVCNLYIDYDGTIGFENIDAIVESFDFSTRYDGVAEFTLNAKISEPKI